MNFIFPAKEKVKAIIFAGHGLNQNPKALHPLFNDFASYGIQVNLYSLPDHGGNREPEFHDKEDSIYLSYHKNLNIVREESAEKQVPFLIFGYSYGGLLGVRYQMEEKIALRGLYFAPALHLRWYAPFIQWLIPWVKKVHSVPIGSAEVENKYRYHQKGVPAGVYRQFFMNYQKVQNDKKSFLNLQAEGLCWIDPLDELVSWQGLKNWTEPLGWDLCKTSNRQGSLRRAHHLNFNSETLGDALYEKVLKSSVKYILNETVL